LSKEHIESEVLQRIRAQAQVTLCRLANASLQVKAYLMAGPAGCPFP